jgi:hypothetical protein
MNVKQEMTDANLERLETKIEASADVNLRETKTRIRTNQDRMEPT